MRQIPLQDAELFLDEDFLAEPDWFERVRQELPWTQGAIRMFGREIPEPRLSCWLGDPEARYRYSGRDLEPLPWPPATAAIKARVEAVSGTRFNSALANLYRDGSDAMGWHADDEPELGDAPVIASISLGAHRKFQLKHKRDVSLDRVDLVLTSGSLLLMRGGTQAHWRHCVPRTRRPIGPRINLTFRSIITAR